METEGNPLNKDFFNFSDCTIKKGIDVITFTIKQGLSLDEILRFLELNRFGKIKHFKLEKGNYQYKWEMMLEIDGTFVSIFYFPKKGKGFLPKLKFKVRDSNKEFFSLIYDFCRYNGIKTNLSFVELFFDFYSFDLNECKTFLEKTIFLRFCRNKSFYFKNDVMNTFYLGNPRKDLKAMRIYKK